MKLLRMTDKQKIFCNEYLIDLNATQACIRAGYSRKTARQIGEQNLSKLYIRTYIEERLAKIESDRIATAAEVMEYLTRVLRGETDEEIVVVEGIGDGCSSAKIMIKSISAKDKLKAAELLAKRYGLLTDKVDINGSMVIFNGEDKLED